MPAVEKPKKLNRTLAGVREALFDALDQMREGTLEPQHARSTVEICKGIVDAASLQLDYEKAWHEKKIGDKLRGIELVPQLESR
jgi:hypothetical protein